jgi:hypothetical protein
MDINRKSAPQKEVVDIARSGEWGKVEYRHRLSCGHVESRKRPSKSPKIACTWCVVASEKERELRSLVVTPPPIQTDEVWDFYDQSSVDEITISSMRSDIASALGCDQDGVEVVASYSEDGKLRINYVTIFLDAEQAERIAAKGKKGHWIMDQNG